MNRTFTPLVAGGLAGAVAAWIIVAGSGTAGSGNGSEPSLLRSVADLALGRERSLNAPIGVNDRLAAYREAQDEADVARLERSIRDLALRQSTLARDLKIDAALMRLAELAPTRAVNLALSIPLDTRLVAAAMLALAEADRAAALALLPGIGDPRMRREVAVALLDIFGDSQPGRDRVSAGLASEDRAALTVAWLARLGVSDPESALREAQSLTPAGLQQDALNAVAVAWAGQDPAGALSQSMQLPETLAQGFRQTVFETWASIDVAGFVNYVESSAVEARDLLSAFSYVLAGDPERAVRLADNLQGTDMLSQSLARSMRLAGQGQLALRDPEAAKATIAALPPGTERDDQVQALASALAQRDPAGAVAWLKSLDPPVPAAMTSLAATISLTDLNAAMNLLDDPSIPAQSSVVMSLIARQAARDPRRAREMANRLNQRDDLESKEALSILASAWIQRDPGNALEWVLSNRADVDPNVLGDAAQSLARRDPLAAVALTDQVPERQRGAWVTKVAAGYGERDPAGALDWLEQFQGQSYYEVAMREAVTAMARTEPRTAAQALTRAGGNIQLGAAGAVASAYARQDPQAAASWAVALSDDRARPQAVRSAMAVWLATNPAAATNFTLALRAGESRDQALSQIITRGASSGDIDADLLNAISSDQTRRETLAVAIPSLARTDRAQANRLLEREVPDANLRRQIEVSIAALDR